MSLYGIIADLRTKYPTPAAAKTLDMVVEELGRTRDNLNRAFANLDSRTVPTSGRPVLEELGDRARAEGLDDLDRPTAPDEALPSEAVDSSQMGIAALLGGSALLAVVLVGIAIYHSIAG